MSGEDTPAHGSVALVECLFEAFGRRDADALLELMSPDIEFYGPTATVLNEGRCYRGHEGIRRYLSDAAQLWQSLEISPRTFREVGNHVVVLGRVKARAADGLELDTPAAWVWRVQAGRIAWGCAYGDREAMPRSLQEEGFAPRNVPPTGAPAAGISPPAPPLS
jgi:ketosteroid isomerase-like protein